MQPFHNKNGGFLFHLTQSKPSPDPKFWKYLFSGSNPSPVQCSSLVCYCLVCPSLYTTEGSVSFICAADFLLSAYGSIDRNRMTKPPHAKDSIKLYTAPMFITTNVVLFWFLETRNEPPDPWDGLTHLQGARSVWIGPSVRVDDSVAVRSAGSINLFFADGLALFP